MRRLLIMALLAFSMAGCINPRNPNPVPPSQLSKDRLLQEHNYHRERRLYPPCPALHIDKNLDSYAQTHAEWMARNTLLRHSNLNVSGWNRVGENIAWGQRDEAHVTDSWMKSPGHRANIMNSRFTHVGFGFAQSSDGQIYWCAVFGG